MDWGSYFTIVAQVVFAVIVVCVLIVLLASTIQVFRNAKERTARKIEVGEPDER